jgi:hypothetical protein
MSTIEVDKVHDNVPVGVEGQGRQERIPVEALEGNLRTYEMEPDVLSITV